MPVRPIVGCLFAVLLTPAALAQSAQVLGKGDATFARSLYDRGYIDLAERLCDAIVKNGTVTPDEKIGIEALHLIRRHGKSVRHLRFDE